MVNAIRGPQGAQAFRGMYAELFSDHAGAAGRAAVRDACRVPRPIAAQELESLTIDTLVLAGRIQSPVLWITAGPENEDAITDAFKRTSVQFGQTVGSGHFPQLEVPDQINAMIGPIRRYSLRPIEARFESDSRVGPT